MFLEKLKTQEDFATLADYFLLDKSKDQMQAREMLKLLIENGCGLDLILKFVASLSTRMLMNKTPSFLGLFPLLLLPRTCPM